MSVRAVREGVGASARRVDGEPKVTRRLRLRRRSPDGGDCVRGDAAQPARIRTHPLDRRLRGAPDPRRPRRPPRRRRAGPEDLRTRVLRPAGARRRRRPLRGRAGRTRRRGDARAGARGRRADRRRLRAAAGRLRHGGGACDPTHRRCTRSATSSATSIFATATPRALSRTCGSRATTRRRCRTPLHSARRAGSPSRRRRRRRPLRRDAVAPRRPAADRPRASASPRKWCGSRSPAWAARSARGRTSTSRSTRAYSRSRTGRPVKIAYGREESFHGHVHRHPSRVWIRYGATYDGRLVAADVRLLLDGGAYASSSPAVLANASTFAAGPYEIPNVPHRGHRRLHEQSALRRDARLRRAAGLLRLRVGDGRARRGARDRPGRAPAAERAAPGLRAADRPGADGQRARARGDRALRDAAAARCAAHPPAGRAASASRSASRTSLQRGLRRRSRGDGDALPRPGRPARRGAHRGRRLRPGSVHRARADRPHRARGRRGRRAPAEHERRLGRLDVGLTPDDDDRRRRPGGLPGGPRGAPRPRRRADGADLGDAHLPPPPDHRLRRGGPGRHPRELRVRRRARDRGRRRGARARARRRRSRSRTTPAA